MKITNRTNGTMWQYFGTTTASDVIVLDGVKSLKNGVSIFKDTSHTLLTLETRWNEIRIEGGSNFEIKL